MNHKASFIVAVAVVLVGLPACARQQHRRSEQASARWTTGPSETYGSEQQRQQAIEDQRMGAGHDLESRTERDELHQPPSSSQDELGALGAQDEATRQQRMADACPMTVSGTEVKSREVPNGVALIFTTEDDVDALRQRVDRFAQLHNEQSSAPMPESGLQQPPGSSGATGTGSESGSSLEGSQAEQGQHHGQHHGSVASRAEVEEIDRGAQIVFTPRNPSELSQLRQEAKREAEQMSGGECPMMGAAVPSAPPSIGG